MVEHNRPLASLAFPVAALAIMATLVVTFHGDGHDPTPALPMASLVLAAFCLRTRATRIALFVPACIVAFAFFSSFASISTSDRSVYRTLVYVRCLEGAFFALLLTPLVVASLRGGGARPGSTVDRSQRRSSWVAAAGTAALFGELSSAYYCGWLLVADRNTPFRHSQWEQGVILLYGIAAMCSLGFLVADLLALTRTSRIAQWARDGAAPPTYNGASIDLGVGEETFWLSSPAGPLATAEPRFIIRGSPARSLRSLAISVVIDLVALVFAVAVAYRRIVAPPE